jgi:sugar lactone lactonase YvrE
MALDERLRESLKALDAMEGRPAEDIVDAVVARGHRYRLLRRLTVGAVAVVAAVTAIAVAPRTLDMWRGDERVPAVPAPRGTVGFITTVAGTGAGYSTGDGGPAAEASLIASGVIGFDADGNLYVQDDDVRVRRIDPSGVITTVVGLSAGGEPAPGEAGSVQGRAGAVDPLGNLYVGADGRVVKVTPSGRVSTVAGTGREGFSGDGGPATEARVSLAYAGMAVDSHGNLYIAQYRYDRVRRVDTNGTITTIAGTGQPGFSGDGGPAREARLDGPTTVSLDGQGNLYVSDLHNHRIRRIDTRGIIATVAGNGEVGFPTDGAVATEVPVGAADVSADIQGNLYVTDEAFPGVFKVGTNGILSIIAGTGVAGYAGDGGPATEAQLSEPITVALGPDGALYIADWGNNRIRKVVLER